MENNQNRQTEKDETIPENQSETIRKSGLAYGAALTLFTSVLVFLGLGYAVDVWLKSSPWGVVGGVVFGSAIGFYQFVRIANQINK
jgi:F0F1-type ATP synthase assembly protein I